MRDRWISHKFHADWFCNSPVQAEMCRHLSQHVAGVTTCITFLHNAFDFLLFEIHRPARRPKDRKSTRLNSSHGYISYAVFCLKKKKWLRALRRHTLGPALTPLSYTLVQRAAFAATLA